MDRNEYDLFFKGTDGVETRNVPKKVDAWMDLTYGMFVHLGLYSELGGIWDNKPVTDGYSEQIQMWANIPHEDYKKVADAFTLTKFDAREIVSLAKESHMTYLVITSKHHDGFCLFDTQTTDFNAVKATPFGQDIIKLLSDECHKQGVGFGIYYSLVDWHLGHEFDHHNSNLITSEMESIIEKQLTELMTGYGDVVEVWFDMGNPTVQQSLKFSRIVQDLQPNAAINGRIWNNKGDFRTLDDNQIPEKKLDGAWQTPASIYNETWGYREWQTRENLNQKGEDCLKSLLSVRARGGNYLLNIGPKGDGSLVPFEVSVLKKVGQWIKDQKSSVLQTYATAFSKPEWGEITVNGYNLYLHVFHYPDNGRVTLAGFGSSVNMVVLERNKQQLNWSVSGDMLTVTLPETKNEMVTTITVGLNERLKIVPASAVDEENGQWMLSKESIEKGYNFTDNGSYTTLKQSVVRMTGYIKCDRQKECYVLIVGKACQHYVYDVSIGDYTRRVKGEDMTKSKIGPFPFASTHSILPVSIMLSNPETIYQDMSLKVEKIIIEETEHVSDNNKSHEENRRVTYEGINRGIQF